MVSSDGDQDHGTRAREQSSPDDKGERKVIEDLETPGENAAAMNRDLEEMTRTLDAERGARMEERRACQEEQDRMTEKMQLLNNEVQLLKTSAAEAGLAALQGQQKLDELQSDLKTANSRQSDMSLVISRLTSEIQTLQSTLGEKSQELQRARAELMQSNDALQKSADLSTAVMDERISLVGMHERCFALEEENLSLKRLATASAAAEEEVLAILERERGVSATSIAELATEKEAGEVRIIQLQTALLAASSDVAGMKVQIEEKDANLVQAGSFLLQRQQQLVAAEEELEVLR